MPTAEDPLHDPRPKTAGRGARRAVVVGAVLSVVAGGLLVWRIRFGDLWDALRAANTIWLLPALGLFFAMFAARACRWSVLLGGTPFFATWHANIIGYFFNATLPLRVGEIARAYVISRSAGVSMPRALSSVLVERLMDLATVVLLFSFFAQRVPMRPIFTKAATLGSVLVVVSVAAGVLVVVSGAAVERRIRPHLQKKLGEARADALLGKVTEIREALGAVGSLRALASSALLTALVWSLTIAIATVSMRAFLPDQADVTKAGLVVVMGNLGGALPSAPGGLGIVQGFATSALVVPFQLPESTALAYVLVWSLSQLLLLVVLGLISVARVGLSFREIREGARGGAAR